MPWPRPQEAARRERIVKPDSSVRDPQGVEHHGAAGPRHLRQRPPRHGAGRPLGALHRPGLRARGAARARRDHPRHAGAGEEPRDAPHRLDPTATRRGSQDGVAGAPRQRLRGFRGPGLGRPVADRRHGRRGARPRRALPLPRALRARPRFVRADRRRRPGTRVRHRDRPRLQRLAEGLLRPRARPDVRRGHGGAARRRRAPSRRLGAAWRSSASRRSSCRRRR